MSNVHIFAQQNSPGVAGEGTLVGARGTRDGIQFTAGWKEALVFEGRVFNACFAAMGATDVVELTSGKDLDQPDFGVSVPNGTALIPLEITICQKVALDTDNDDNWFLVMGDPDAAYANDGTVVSVTPDNNISDGGVTSVATVFENASGNITAPTATKIFICGKQEIHGLTTSGGPVSDLNLHWVADVPIILKGPAAFYGWGGGTDAPTFFGSVTWAEVPEARYTV